MQTFMQYTQIFKLLNCLFIKQHGVPSFANGLHEALTAVHAPNRYVYLPSYQQTTNNPL